MGVLVEAIAVVVRRNAIRDRFSGGWEAFVDAVPNGTLCADDDLACVHFMCLPDANMFVSVLEEGGLVVIRDGVAVDAAVVDQFKGPLFPVAWLEFARLRYSGAEGGMAVCWLWDAPRDCGFGTYFPAGGVTIVCPQGWRFEGSLSHRGEFVTDDELAARWKFLRNEWGCDVYLDPSTGEERFVGRTKGQGTREAG